MYFSPRLVMENLTLCLDSANPKSYPGSGTTISDLSSSSKSLTLSTAAIGTDNPGTLTFLSPRTSSLGSTLIGDSDSFTISMWCYITSDEARGGVFQRKSSSPYNGIAFGKGGPTNAYASLIDTSSNSLGITFTQYLSTWVEYTITFNASTKTLNGYTNSSLTDTDTNSSFTNVILDSSDNLAVGWRPPNSYFVGQIGQINIYSRVLLTPELTQNYNALKSRYQ